MTIPDPERDGPMQALATNAEAFEKRMPWDDKWKRASFRTPASAAVRAMAATGAAGPIGYVGKNLPNPQALRETYGTKNFVVLAWMDAYGDLHGTRRLDEFAPEEVRAEVGRCASSLDFANIALHEVTGHGSGKVEPSLKADPAEILGSDYSTMEEGRAQLVADYLLMDPKVLEIGLVADAACQRAAAAWSTAGLLMWHAAVAQGEVVEEDHMRAGMIQLGYLIDKGVVKPEVRGGKTFLLVADPDAWHHALGELLGEHQRIRATGDKAAMKALVDKWGSRLNPRWRDEVLARLQALSLPPATALIPPMLAPVLGDGGKVVDATATQAASVDEYIAYLEAAWVD